jgi:hypothetical protein
MRFGLLIWIGVLSSIPCWAQSPPQLLHHLSAGTKLVPTQPIIIPANTDQITLVNRAMPGSICKLRVKEPKPFDRVINDTHPLVVSGTSRSGFSSPHRASLWTYVEFNSRGVDDLICVADRGSHEMTFTEFEKVLAGEFLIKLPERHPVVID